MAEMRVGFLGDGHISGVLRDAVEQTRPHLVVGTFGRDALIPDGLDVVVEAATQQAVRERVPGLLAGGVDVILLSVGAMADATLRTTLLAGPGQLIACTGAIGGLDQVRALRAAGPLREVSLESRKLPATLVQPWMADELQERLRRGTEEIVLAEGLAADVARQFPTSANVAASLALAADAWDTATARVIADPTATHTRHEVFAAGDLGEVRAVVVNAPSPDRPRSSAIVAWAALRALDDYARMRSFAAPGGVAFL
ncbi:aspartate dehydrogenase domain-containing protein [Microbacterium keratanolyticum]